MGTVATSICVKCGGTTFDFVSLELRDITHRFSAIQCADCGGVAGVVDAVDIPDMIDQLSQQVERLAQDLDARVPQQPSQPATDPRLDAGT